jgi:hypothetical protein
MPSAPSPLIPLLLLHTSAHAAFLQKIMTRHRKFTASDGHEYSRSTETTDEGLEWTVSMLRGAYTSSGKDCLNSCRIYSASTQMDILLHGTQFHLVVRLALRSRIRISQ